MDLQITRDGRVRCLYGEALDLAVLGRPVITRGSDVEPTEEGRWMAEPVPGGRPRLGPFSTRSAALAAEREWLTRHWLFAPDLPAEPLRTTDSSITPGDTT